MNGLTNYLGHLQVYVIVIGGETVSGVVCVLFGVICVSASARARRQLSSGARSRKLCIIRFKLRIFKQKPGSRLTL